MMTLLTTDKLIIPLTNKVPESLRKIIADSKTGKKKILVLINPPWAEAGSSDNYSNQNKNTAKSEVAKSKFADKCMNIYGKATNELFIQFVARIAKEIPNATLAMFSKLKYVNATNFEDFRMNWNAEYLDGFVVHSKSFEGLKGEFPIGFLIWKTNNSNRDKFNTINEISCEVLDKMAQPIGRKSFYNKPSEFFLSKWIDRPKCNNEEVIGLKNCVSPNGTGFWSDNAISHFVCDSNDLQQAGQGTVLLSSLSKIGHKGAIYVNEKNLWQTAVVFTVRRIIPHTWINDRDQFLQPSKELSDEFKNDCLVWMLFNGSNLTASADGLEWNNQKWSIVNHFIPFTETEVNAPDRFESDFMVQYMADKIFSAEAQNVLEQGKVIWQKYFEIDINHSIREEFKLNRADVGWYQIRQAIKKYNELGENLPVSFENFESAYLELTEKLRPQVYIYGFLK